MSRVRSLYDLQQTDSKIDLNIQTIARLNEAIEDKSGLETARQKLSEAESNLVAARSYLGELEADGQKQQEHADSLEKKLYGGEIKGTKEMAAAQQEIETFRLRKKETDNESVEAMLDLEDAEADFREAKENVVTTEAEWQKANKAYIEERDRVEAENIILQDERERRLKMVMPPDVPLYEKLRRQKQGVAVSEVMFGKTCTKCRVELPMARQRDIKGGNTIVTCPSCGRILFHKF